MKLLKILLLAIVPAGYVGYRLIKNKHKAGQKINAVEINNLVNGISNKDEMAKLYKRLIIKTHPDKNGDKLELSEAYTVKINQFRRDYNKLKELAIEIDDIF